MKKQDIIDAINIDLEYFRDNLVDGLYRRGLFYGLNQAKNIIDQLDQGEMQFAKDISTTNSEEISNQLVDKGNESETFKNEASEYKCNKDDCHCHIGIGCTYFTRHCLCCRGK